MNLKACYILLESCLAVSIFAFMLLNLVLLPCASAAMTLLIGATVYAVLFACGIAACLLPSTLSFGRGSLPPCDPAAAAACFARARRRAFVLAGRVEASTRRTVRSRAAAERRMMGRIQFMMSWSAARLIEESSLGCFV